MKNENRGNDDENNFVTLGIYNEMLLFLEEICSKYCINSTLFSKCHFWTFCIVIMEQIRSSLQTWRWNSFVFPWTTLAMLLLTRISSSDSLNPTWVTNLQRQHSNLRRRRLNSMKWRMETTPRSFLHETNSTKQYLATLQLFRAEKKTVNYWLFMFSHRYKASIRSFQTISKLTSNVQSVAFMWKLSNVYVMIHKACGTCCFW